MALPFRRADRVGDLIRRELSRLLLREIKDPRLSQVIVTAVQVTPDLRHALGEDLHAAHDVTLAPGARALVPTGLALALPHGCAGLVVPRSGLALRHGVSIVNAPAIR